MNTFTVKDLNKDLDTKALRALFKMDTVRHIADMLFNWVVIIGTIVICTKFYSPALYVFAVLVIGARMHALAILMHDATHFRFLKKKKLNDLVTNFVSMYHLFSSIEQYRQNHLRHHQHLNTEDDPDWFVKLGRSAFTFPKTKIEFLLRVLSYLTLVQGILDALWFLKRFAGPAKEEKTSFKDKLPRLGYYAVLVTVLTVFGGWKLYLMYWIVPYLSTFFMYQYIRSVSEHFGELEYDHLLTSTRTFKFNLIERFFLAPHNVGYHLEHHLYPGVPYYNLPKLHALLMQTDTYNSKAHVTVGFWSGLMNELGGK